MPRLLAACGIVLLLAQVTAAQDKDFAAWLETYKAYDVMARELGQREQTPEVILRRARAQLNSGRAEEAHSLLRGNATFRDEQLEKTRLWLIGQAARKSGRLDNAVFAFSRALGPMPSEDDLKKLRQENVQDVWKDVWRVWFWRMSVSGDQDVARSQRSLLGVTMAQGRRIWPQSDFWTPAEDALKASGSSVPIDASTEFVSESDRRTLVRCLAAVALGNWQSADSLLTKLSNSHVSRFWEAFITLLHTGQTPGDGLAFRQQGLLKPASFWEGYFSELGPYDPADWVVEAPQSSSWSGFMSRIADLEPDTARELVGKELESTLLSEVMAEKLRHVDLALAFQLGNVRLPDLDSYELEKLPRSLKVAAVIGLGMHPERFFTGTEDERTTGARLTAILAESAGMRVFPKANVPFWSVLSNEDLQSRSASHPLDQLLLIASLRAAWADNNSIELAKRIGYLFPTSRLGSEALLHLAEEAGNAGAFQVSGFYLSRVDEAKLSGEARTDYLQAKAALQVQLGRNKEGLETYMRLMEMDSGRLEPVKRLKLALLAQRQGRYEWAQSVLDDLWAERERLNDAEQAETLFWMAEGAEAQGRRQSALERYLRVGWKYPGQNIWAVTALYRAALIMETEGEYETAKRLLGTVIKAADRESQKEAAQQRLEQVEARRKSEDGQVWAYPF
ncbi:tetratricopeptide repeat protein [Desulfohalovibrio reitneri]|uniref:tetratricopeptide repeat protein n=1 Tax=Desulfohalovibrio reitneri TaxID=1307759 RepID=UPI0004A72FD7|nr:tetratricopeptide repeat protein [Desulfohalovibrio reitneri]